MIAAAAEAGALLERDPAIAAVRAAVTAGRNLLVHGPAGAGKTALLRAALAGQARQPLFCSAVTAAGLYRQALCALGAAGEREAEALSSLRCRQKLAAAFAARPCCLVWDPAPAASRTLANGLRDLLRRGSVPLVCAAASPHMEAIGCLSIFFSLQSERLHVPPLSEAAARQLAEREVDRLQLQFDDAEQVLAELLRRAKGRPGEIKALLAMTRLPRYRQGGRIKLHVLYLDRLTGVHRGD
ncbi:MAG TPA: hypothetical protein VNF74_01175 [Terriglobales bacterium]|nr:hypothetical protein [Terriglobales bacterium]